MPPMLSEDLDSFSWLTFSTAHPHSSFLLKLNLLCHQRLCHQKHFPPSLVPQKPPPLPHLHLQGFHTRPLKQTPRDLHPNPLSPKECITHKVDPQQKTIEINNVIVQMLGSKGYASFSIALHSVLDGIQKDSVSLSSATIFAPPDLKLLGSPSTLLDRAVRLHILPQRFTNKELSFLPVRTLLKTLVPDEQLEIDGVLDFMPGVVISGVEIVEPDMLTSEKFVVHGISRAFKMTELTA
ncbi:FAS1 domain [Sesbania bispinosa]|nr:FAS1 domain [Sesbania bispinosa]